MTVEKKTASKPTVKAGTARKAVAKGKSTTRTATAPVAATPSAADALASRESHFSRIQKEAYLLAEKDGFKGDPTRYWLAAEANVLRAER